MNPRKLTKAQLLEALRDITESISNDDSFEGSISYSCMEESCGRDEFMVQGSWRIGNSQGQGGMSVIGNDK